MARTSSTQPTDRELEILHVLWELEPAGLGPIRESLSEHRQVAPTTVATMLGVMRDKNLVRRRQGKRGYEWSAVVSRDEAARGLVGQLLDRVFDGSAQRLVAHLVDGGRLSAAELSELKMSLADHDATNQPAQEGRP